MTTLAQQRAHAAAQAAIARAHAHIRTPPPEPEPPNPDDVYISQTVARQMRLQAEQDRHHA